MDLFVWIGKQNNLMQKNFRGQILQKQSKQNCSRCELTLYNAPWDVKVTHASLRDPR